LFSLPAVPLRLAYQAPLSRYRSQPRWLGAGNGAATATIQS
jgi:hypothetical protein